MTERSQEKEDPSDPGFDPLPIDRRFDFRTPNQASTSSDARIEDDMTVITPKERQIEEPPQGQDPDELSLIDRHLGNYKILSVVGRGGFGTVYRAQDIRLDRFVALKMLRFPMDPDLKAQFVREAKILADMAHHPSIVQIYAWDEYEGNSYFVMEYLDTSAETLLARAGAHLGLRDALRIISDCAAALQCVHERNIFHRDIKPANILIDSRTGRAKLCDFGLARFRTFDISGVCEHIEGTPPYMAPEQITHGQIDARTDLYELGITLYRLLSGHLPYEGRTVGDVIEKIRSEPPCALSEYRPDLTESVRAIVDRAISKRPGDRYHTAAELKRAVDQILLDLDSSGETRVHSHRPNQRRSSWRRRAWALGAIALVFASVFLIDRQVDRPPWPEAVAQAKELVDSGDLDEAQAALQAYVANHPADDRALYVFGFVHLLRGEFEASAAQFGAIEDEGLREEGLSALTFARENENARASLEAALKLVPTKYPALLLASLDVANGNYQQAINRLRTVEETGFNFEWQRRDMRRLLAQAYLAIDDYDAAQAQLSRLSDEDPITDVMRIQIAKQREAETREAISTQIQRIRSYATSVTPDDEWTSRPISARVEPPTAVRAYFDHTRDLARYFSGLLAPHLESNSNRPISIVDRESIGDVLFEQELATMVPNGDSVALGKILGARLMIEPEFGSMLGQEFVRIRLIDTETSEVAQLERIAIPPGFGANDVDEWLEKIAQKISEVVAQQYPLQARISANGSGAQINIGSNCGVSVGRQFDVFPTPQSANPLDGVFAEVVDPVGTDSAPVRLNGASIQSLPTTGWFAREIVTQ
jgi:serine/threonine protein kinase